MGYNELAINDIVEAIDEALNMWNPKFAKLLINRAKIFSDTVFRKKILYVVEKYASSFS